MNLNPNNSSDNNAMEDDDYPCFEFHDAFDELSPSEQLAYESLVSLDKVIGEDYDYHELTAESIFSRIANDEYYKYRIELGFKQGLTEQEMLEGFSEMYEIFWHAQEWARDLKKGREWDDEGGITDLTVDCFISECADYDEDLDAIRWRNPLLYSAICIELSRAVGSH